MLDDLLDDTALWQPAQPGALRCFVSFFFFWNHPTVNKQLYMTQENKLR